MRRPLTVGLAPADLQATLGIFTGNAGNGVVDYASFFYDFKEAVVLRLISLSLRQAHTGCRLLLQDFQGPE